MSDIRKDERNPREEEIPDQADVLSDSLYTTRASTSPMHMAQAMLSSKKTVRL
ncbi:MAG: hypothetical protein U0V48_06150 [Anaerolineales bacterium]